MNVLSRVTLRGRFLLLVVLGIVVPLGFVGLWLTQSSARLGEELVRTRLATALGETVEAFGHRWSRYRSLLLDLADAPAVQQALRSAGETPAASDPNGRAQLTERWIGVSAFAWLIEVRDTEGRVVARLPDDLGELRSTSAPPPGFLNYTIRLRGFSGDDLGMLDVQFRSDGLLPSGTPTAGIGGSVLAILDRRTGSALTPLPVDPEVFGRERFRWGDDEWVTAVRDVVDPPVRFAVAAALGPITEPFEDAARRGTVALLISIAIVFVLTTLFTRRLTRSLEGLSSAATAVAGGDLDARVQEAGPPAVRETARAFNAMSGALRQTLERLSQREALAAVGEFAASLAHEVRNPLTAIRMDLQRAAGRMEDDPEAAKLLAGRALAQIDRLNASVTDFLRVARSGRVTFATIDLRAPLEAAVRAAEPRLATRHCTLDYTPPTRPTWVRGDEGALEELVLNLLLNAADAVDVGGHARLRLEDSDPAARVSVWDDGSGLPPGAGDQIFEPLFTTKPDGTGLGLAIARRIARAHGSDLEVESAPGVGTTFRFHLTTVTAPANRIDTRPPDGRHESGR